MKLYLVEDTGSMYPRYFFSTEKPEENSPLEIVEEWEIEIKSGDYKKFVEVLADVIYRPSWR